MERHRTLAGSPVRSASATWAALTDMIVASLEVSEHIDGSEVRTECEAVGEAISAVIAGGYLATDRLVLVADPMYVHFTVANGNAAFAAEEDEQVAAVPGGRNAAKWQLYIDAPDTLIGLLGDATTATPHITCGTAPAYSAKAASHVVGVDFNAMRNMTV
jgi:hypothetical protein